MHFKNSEIGKLKTIILFILLHICEENDKLLQNAYSILFHKAGIAIVNI